ncbi:MAG: 3-phosphoshikimate 1-carboxyvinyltransferase [Clostridia bacterium]|nr:3-phosphoshikimate 1-carboxyvinyltransferase [Clostridia bacterium]MBR6688146.1 3-phosphoshikimate 1-carboxyvinyltransferase [Clostridia bacterium]
MMIRVRKSHITGKVDAIVSKSFAHRIAICNFLAKSGTILPCDDSYSEDIKATVRCLEAIKSGKTQLDCGESGSTLRFMLPLCAAIGGEFEFFGHGKLMERPNDELFSALESSGVKIEQGKTIKLSGKLKSGQYKIRGDISSQYISGLLMALPILDGDSTIVLTTPMVSTGYIDITLKVLKEYGITPIRTGDGFIVSGGQTFKGSMDVEGDWSNAAPFLCMGAIFDKVSVGGLNLDSVQGDKFIIDILKMAGADVKQKDGLVTATPTDKLKAFSFNAENCPDLVPVASALAAFCDGKTEIYGVERLKIKESDRIASTIKMLEDFNIKADYDGQKITIFGGEALAGKVDSFNDHRIVMASTILALAADGESQIWGYKAINKSFPQFFECVKAIGGDFDAM